MTPHISCPTASARLIIVMPRPVELLRGETKSPSDCRAPIVTIRIAAAAIVTTHALGVLAFEVTASIANDALADRLHVGREYVPGASLRANQRRLRVLGFKLLPQAADLNVDRPVVHLVVVQARRIEQLFA